MSYQRLLELEKLISIYDNAYHNLDIELVTDEEYNLLYMEWKNLLKLFPDHESAIAAGFVHNKGKLIPINEPMLSVNKFNDKEKFLKLAKRFGKYTYEEKLDGVGVRVLYNPDGSIKSAHLRGDGRGGRDITSRLYLVKGVVKQLPKPTGEESEVTGEVTCTEEDFKNYCTEYGLIDKTARSIVAGFLRRDEEAEDETLQLHFVAFHASKNVRDKCKTYPKLVKWFKDHGFNIPASFEEFPESKPESVFPIDGVVIKDNKLENWDGQPITGYYSYAGCFKYPTDIAVTKVNGVTWGLTTQGFLTGVINFRPTPLMGAILKRCQFHYPALYIKNGIRIGSEIEITRGNEIVPKLLGMVEAGDGELITFPDSCPYCEEQLSHPEPDVYRCENNTCPGQISARLLRLVSTKGLDIDGIGEKKAAQLIASNLVEFPHDIFTLTKEDLAKVEIKGNKANKLIAEIAEHRKSKPLANWLFALAIPELGEIRALALEDELHSNEEVLSTESVLSMLSSIDALKDMFGIDGIKIASYVIPNYRDLEIFLNYFDWENYKAPSETLKGPRIPVAITGHLKFDRKVLKEILRAKGYCLDNIVTKDSTYLMIGGKPSPGKVALAERYDIPTINVSGMSIEDIIAFLEARK